MAMGHRGTEGPGANDFHKVPETQWFFKAGHHQRALHLERVRHHIYLQDYVVKGGGALQVQTVGVQCVLHIIAGLST